jgi:hypothetical protein
MKNRVIWAAALLLAVFALATRSQAYSRKGSRVQVIMRADGAGHWKMWIFGIPACSGTITTHQAGPAEPVEFDCGK